MGVYIILASGLDRGKQSPWQEGESGRLQNRPVNNTNTKIPVLGKKSLTFEKECDIRGFG